MELSYFVVWEYRNEDGQRHSFEGHSVEECRAEISHRMLKNHGYPTFWDSDGVGFSETCLFLILEPNEEPNFEAVYDRLADQYPFQVREIDNCSYFRLSYTFRFRTIYDALGYCEAQAGHNLWSIGSDGFPTIRLDVPADEDGTPEYYVEYYIGGSLL